MPRRLALAMALLFVTPVAGLVVAAVQAARGEQQMLEARLQALVRARLNDVRAQIAAFTTDRARELDSVTVSDAESPMQLRAYTAAIPFVDQLLITDSKGRLVYPPPSGATTATEQAFLRRTEHLWTARDSFVRPSEGAAPRSGWYTWYWENGLGVIYWRRLPSGGLVAFELTRGRLLADLIARLPARRDQEPAEAGCTRLVDSRGEAIYQWGDCESSAAPAPFVELALAPPLEAMRLQYVAVAGLFGTTLASNRLTVYAAVAALVLALAGLAAYVFRESTRAVREAQTRVSFVNHVSHELKTPLTNIRMYAELLQARIEDDVDLERYLGIVVSESQRLSRLISNVLTFARHERNELKLHPTPQVLDRIVEDVLAQFAPSLAQKQLTAKLIAAAPTPALIDADAVAQIVANLVGNAEKYARGGGTVTVTTRQDKSLATVLVADQGTGIPTEQAERIFQPYVRLSGQLTEGVAGTGIGLTIARALARLHGGDLKLLPSTNGASFVVTLHAPEVKS